MIIRWRKTREFWEMGNYLLEKYAIFNSFIQKRRVVILLLEEKMLFDWIEWE